jgi:hypothetical protein
LARDAFDVAQPARRDDNIVTTSAPAVVETLPMIVMMSRPARLPLAASRIERFEVSKAAHLVPRSRKRRWFARF